MLHFYPISVFTPAGSLYRKTSCRSLNYLTAVSVALGVFLLAVSLLEWGAAYGAKADALHRNAEDLTAYQLKLAHVLARMDAGKVVEDPEVDELRLEYESIKNRCPYNHEPVDHDLFIAQQRLAPEFRDVDGKPRMTCWRAFFVKVHWNGSTIWFLLLVWMLVLFAALWPFVSQSGHC